MADRTLKAVALRLLEYALTPDTGCFPIVVVQGALAIGLGVAIAVRGYVRAGFRWPSERGGWS